MRCMRNLFSQTSDKMSVLWGGKFDEAATGEWQGCTTERPYVQENL